MQYCSGIKKQLTEPNALLSVTEFATSSYDMEEYILLATYFHRMSTQNQISCSKIYIFLLS
jgi:hypothetical protein